MIFFALPLQADIPLLTGHLKPLLVRNLVDTAVSLVTLACLVHWGLAAAAVAAILGPGQGLPLDRLVLAGISGGCLWAGALGLLRHPAWREMTRAAAGVRSLALRHARA